MNNMKPPAKANPATEQVDEKVMVKVYGPYDNPKFGRSVLIISDSGKAYIVEKNCLIENLMAYEVKELKGDEDELGVIVNDISKIVCKPLDTQKGKGGSSVDMGPTNDILNDILGMLTSVQSTLTSLALKKQRADKKKKAD